MARTTAALIMAAGRGARFGGDIPKQYQSLRGQSVLARTIASFARHPRVDLICCVYDAEMTQLFQEATRGEAPQLAVVGGATRQDSVRAGLEALARLNHAPDYVLIHDAARPCAPHAVIDAVIERLTEVDAAAPVLPVADTVSSSDGERFGDEIDRSGLLRRQTPQGFRFHGILEAHRRFPDAKATDDIALARLAGLHAVATPGSMRLHKLTTPDDRALLEAMIDSSSWTAVGQGFDVHAFGPGDQVILCGVAIPHGQSLSGHSDADVAMHALTDAMLGAIGGGDIGQLFPPSDPQWRGADSAIFLERARNEIEQLGARLDSVDVTIICEAPKVGPHRDAMRARLAELLRLPLERVNVKATTTERLGFTGRGEGIAAMATASVTRWR